MDSLQPLRWPLIVVGLVCCVALGFSAVAVMDNKEDVLTGLEMLAQGYDSANAGLTQYDFEGRVFTEQRSASATRQAPSEKTIGPVWESFRLVRVGQRRRYEKVNPENSNLNVAAVDDGDKITNFGGISIVRVFSRDPAQDKWGGLTRDYNEYISMMPWWPDIRAGLAGLQDRINKGFFDVEDATLTLERDPGGLFILHGKLPGDECTCWIDPAKGYNIVKAHGCRDYPNKGFHSDFWQEAEFAQNPDGYWYLKAGRLWGEENGVSVEHQMLVEKAQFGNEVQVPEGFFDRKSLGIPSNTYIIDFRFTPPLESGGPTLDAGEVDALMQAKPSLSEVVSVERGKGTVKRADFSQMVKELEGERAHRVTCWAVAIGLVLATATGLLVRSIARRRKS